MHAVWQIPEIVGTICDEALGNPYDSPTTELASLARVRRSISEVALDVLWRDVTIPTLLYLFPPDALVDIHNQSFVRPLRSSDWTRFFYYAPRVQKLRYLRGTPSNSSRVIDFDNVLTTLADCRPQTHILPNLRHVEWEMVPTANALKLNIFLVPSLTVFDISLSSRDFHGSPSQDEKCAALLWALWNTRSPLRKLHVNYPENFSSTTPQSQSRVQEACGALIHQNPLLKDVGLVPDIKSMRTLGQLTELYSLALYLRNVELLVSEILPSSSTPFPALGSLRIDVQELDLIIPFLMGTQCYPRHKIVTICGNDCIPTKMLSFLQVVIHPVQSHTLRVFEFYVQLGELGSELDADVCRITVDYIRPLLGCPNLEKVHFDYGFPLALNDRDLHTLMSAWPKISSLNLSARLQQEAELTWEPHISLQGLKHLSAGMHLRNVKLSLTVEDTSQVPQLPPTELRSNSPLETLELGFSYLGEDCATGVASCLARWFPALQTISTAGYFGTEHDLVETRWEKVRQELTKIRHRGH